MGDSVEPYPPVQQPPPLSPIIFNKAGGDSAEPYPPVLQPLPSTPKYPGLASQPKLKPGPQRKITLSELENIPPLSSAWPGLQTCINIPEKLSDANERVNKNKAVKLEKHDQV